MPFILIKDRLKPDVGIPDEDSLHFLANNPALWKSLDDNPVKLGTSNKSKHIALAPSLEAIKTTTSKMN